MDEFIQRLAPLLGHFPQPVNHFVIQFNGDLTHHSIMPLYDVFTCSLPPSRKQPCRDIMTQRASHAKRSSNIVPFPVREKFRGYEPSADAVALAMKEAERLGELIDEQTARRLLIELDIDGFDPE